MIYHVSQDDMTLRLVEFNSTNFCRVVVHQASQNSTKNRPLGPSSDFFEFFTFMEPPTRSSSPSFIVIQLSKLNPNHMKVH